MSTTPTPTLEVQTLDGQSHTLKMTFNHLNRIASTLTGIEGAAIASSTADGRDLILATMFGKRDENGKFIPADVDALEISPDVAGEVFNWVTEHLTDFFVKRLAKSREMLASMVPEIQKMKDPQFLKDGSKS